MSYFSHSSELPAWIGQLPENWDRDWLKWSVSLATERSCDMDRDQLPYLSNEDIESWTGKLLKDALEPAEADSRKFRAGDVLFNKLRPYLAKVFHAEFDGASSGELLCLRPCVRVLPRYLFYVLTSKGFIDIINAETFGSKMPRADWETVGHQPLPLPSLKTQRRIAQFLDSKTAQIDALIEKKRALLDRLAEKRQALITHAVTKGLNPNTPMKDSGIDWLGEIPAHWRALPLKRVKRFMTSGSRGWAAYYADDGDVFLRMTNVTKDGVEIDEEDIRHVCLDGASEGIRTAIQENDILITITAELGSVAIARKKHEGAYINQHLALFRCDKELCSADFLVNYLSTDLAREQFLLSGQGGTKQGLGFDQVDGVLLGLPPLHEQVGIALFLAKIRGRFRPTEIAMKQQLNFLTEYRSALITAAVTGQLDLEAA